MKKFNFLFILCAMMAFTSCLNNDSDDTQTTVTRNYTQCFNSVYDNATGEIVLTTQPKYVFNIIYKGDGSIYGQISMTNVSLGIDIPYTNFDLPELKFTLTGNSAPVIKATDVFPTNLANAHAVTFTEVRLSVLDRVLKNENTLQQEIYTAYSLSFTVNNRYEVTVYPTQYYYFGTTGTVADADGSEFSTTSPRYAISLNPQTKKASIDITGAQFVSNMPAMNMTFGDIDFTTTRGNLVMEKDALTPTINNTPFPTFPISELTAMLNPEKTTGTLRFNCTAATMGAYKVAVALQEEPINPKN
ncbi:MAG: hypothetical protein HDS11_07015 [Bacteroides sp.]|nr:hypothetical protein [Bacteroides sp.]